MTNRRKLIVGNWKMNGLSTDGLQLTCELARRAKNGRLTCDLLVCPPATLIAAIGAALAGSSIALGGQNCHEMEKGAYTGEISAEMLRDAGCTYVIVGHAERRHGCGETDEQVCAKVKAAWRAGLVPIVCVGETSHQRDAGATAVGAIVAAQLRRSLPPGASADKLIVAYEPIWAIGSGSAPTLTDITNIHQAIRAEVPAGTRILYGGSVNTRNATEILSLDEVDGALVGSASLKAADFWAIAEAC